MHVKDQLVLILKCDGYYLSLRFQKEPNVWHPEVELIIMCALVAQQNKYLALVFLAFEMLGRRYKIVLILVKSGDFWTERVLLIIYIFYVICIPETTSM